MGARRPPLNSRSAWRSAVLGDNQRSSLGAVVLLGNIRKESKLGSGEDLGFGPDVGVEIPFGHAFLQGRLRWRRVILDLHGIAADDFSVSGLQLVGELDHIAHVPGESIEALVVEESEITDLVATGFQAVTGSSEIAATSSVVFSM